MLIMVDTRQGVPSFPYSSRQATQLHADNDPLICDLHLRMLEEIATHSSKSVPRGTEKVTLGCLQ